MNDALADPFTTIERLKMTYISTRRDDDLRDKFSKIYKRHGVRMTMRESGTGGPHLYEGTMLAVSGETQAGKTTAIVQLFKQYPEFKGYEDIANGAPLISMRAPPACTPIRLALELLAALGFPLKSYWPEHKLWAEVHRRLRLNKISVVHIDEMQHTTHVANEKEILRLGASLKSLLVNPDWPVILVVAGVPTLMNFLNQYPELLRRTTFCLLPALNVVDNADEMANIASLLCGMVGLSLNTDSCDHFGERLITAARLQFGGVVEWTIDAIGVALLRRAKQSDPAIRLDPNIDHNDFAVAYAEKKDCPPISNVFLSEDWHLVEPPMGPDPASPSDGIGGPKSKARAKRNKRRNF